MCMQVYVISTQEEFPLFVNKSIDSGCGSGRGFFAACAGAFHAHMKQFACMHQV